MEKLISAKSMAAADAALAGIQVFSIPFCASCACIPLDWVYLYIFLVSISCMSCLPD